MSAVETQPRQLAQPRRANPAAAPQRLVRLLVRGFATIAIVFGAPLNLRTLSDFGPPR